MMTKHIGSMAVAGLLVVLLAGCSTTDTGKRNNDFSPPDKYVAPVTFAPEGDSITNWVNGDTWPAFAQADDLVLVNGFAAGGQKIAVIADGTPNCHCDVVVVMAGTNDMSTPSWATPIGQMGESLVRLVQNSGASHALILAIAPRDRTGRLAGDPSWGDAWNAEQKRLAEFYGWDYYDPWGFLRAPDGQFLPGTTVEGVHPTVEAQRTLGNDLHDVIIGVARD